MYVFVLGAIELNRRLFCVVKNQALGRGGKIEFGSGISNPCVPSCSCIQNYDQTVSRSHITDQLSFLFLPYFKHFKLVYIKHNHQKGFCTDIRKQKQITN